MISFRKYLWNHRFSEMISGEAGCLGSVGQKPDAGFLSVDTRQWCRNHLCTNFPLAADQYETDNHSSCHIFFWECRDCHLQLAIAMELHLRQVLQLASIRIFISADHLSWNSPLRSNSSIGGHHHAARCIKVPAFKAEVKKTL